MPESLFVVTTDAAQIALVDPAGGEHRIAWSDIARIIIRTTDEGPLLPDVFWIIEPVDGTPIVIPGGATGEDELLRVAQSVLPGFRNDQMIAAMSSTDCQDFVVWERA